MNPDDQAGQEIGDLEKVRIAGIPEAHLPDARIALRILEMFKAFADAGDPRPVSSAIQEESSG